jgi:hypothetical protein
MLRNTAQNNPTQDERRHTDQIQIQIQIRTKQG